MMRKPLTKVTAQDVAARAGVSQPTVSRVFSNGHSVRPQLRDKVLAAASDLGYRPNTLARSLTTGRSRTIGVVMAYLDNPFYPEVLEKLSNALRQLNYHVMVFFAANFEYDIDRVVEDLLAHQVDGIIFASVNMSNDLTGRLNGTNIPFILFNRGQTGGQIASVTSANYEGGRLAAEFLVAGGHRRIAHISGWKSSLNAQERQQGFKDALGDAGMAPAFCIDGEFSRRKAAEAARTMMDDTNPPDAIFVGNDHMAFAVLEALRHDVGARVPEDVSVIGYDDVQMASWSTYNLTTLRQPANRMVDATVTLLMSMIDDNLAGKPALRQKVEITSDIIIRSSARVPESWESR